jgi:hypothetical protein
MKRLPDLLIAASVLLLLMSMSAFSQSSRPAPNDNVESSSKSSELPKIIVRSAAKGSWAAVRITTKHVVVPATEYVLDQSAETAPKLTRVTVRGLSATASNAASAG